MRAPLVYKREHRRPVWPGRSRRLVLTAGRRWAPANRTHWIPACRSRSPAHSKSQLNARLRYRRAAGKQDACLAAALKGAHPPADWAFGRLHPAETRINLLRIRRRARFCDILEVFSVVAAICAGVWARGRSARASIFARAAFRSACPEAAQVNPFLEQL